VPQGNGLGIKKESRATKPLSRAPLLSWEGKPERETRNRELTTLTGAWGGVHVKTIAVHKKELVLDLFQTNKRKEKGAKEKTT